MDSIDRFLLKHRVQKELSQRCSEFLTDRMIADRCACSPSYVSRMRRKLEKSGAAYGGAARISVGRLYCGSFGVIRG